MEMIEHMVWHIVSKYSFTKWAIWLDPGKVEEIIAQCFIIYEPGFLEDLQKLHGAMGSHLHLWGLCQPNAYTFASTI